MIRSMTGFGTADGTVGGARVTVDLRTVNHRFFNPSIKLPADFGRWEADVRDALRRRISRGHVSLTARSERTTPAVTIDEARFGTYVELLRGLRDRFGLGGDVDLATVLRMPEVVATNGDGEDGSAAELVRIVETAVDALDRSRRDEGERLAAVLLDRLAVIAAAVGRIRERAPARLLAQRERLRESVRQLADGVAVDEQRLAQEIAILADRLDVQEELDRFDAHIAAFRAAVADTGHDPVGKRLGFLLQELLREANTTGSKANDAAIVQDVLVVKEELERIREQVENLE
jgi:uncharacterized protein (TIGR00255 family)